MKQVGSAFLAGLLLMGAGVYYWQHRQADPLSPVGEPKSEVTKGPFHRTETVAVGEVVNDIRRLNRLVIFQSYVTAITTTHDVGWLTQTDQTMITPAFVNYYIDMDDVDARKIRVNGKHVFVLLPAIRIERPNIDTRNVIVFNDGVWSNLTTVSDRLRMKNNAMSLRQLVGKAKMPFLVSGARAAAVAAEEVNIRRALAAAGHADLVVHIVAA